MAEAKKIKQKELKEAELIVEAAPIKPKAKEDTPKTTAKAGKRSSKATAEAEQRQAKEIRKTQKIDKTESKKALKPIRTKAQRAGKKYREAAKLIDKSKSYSLAEAIELAVKTSTTNFDATVEMHLKLGVDPKKADQNVRDTVVLPAGTGRSLKIAVLTEADDVAKAKSAGADLAGSDEIFARLDKQEFDFDILIAVPSLMPKLGKYAKLLGPRGLMPNPKSGTVSQNTVEAVKEAKAGRVEYRVDQFGIIHLAIGKVSFGPAKLLQNAEAVMSSVRAAKPASLKGIYIQAIHVSSTMGPGIKVVTAA